MRVAFPAHLLNSRSSAPRVGAVAQHARPRCHRLAGSPGGNRLKATRACCGLFSSGRTGCSHSLSINDLCFEAQGDAIQGARGECMYTSSSSSPDDSGQQGQRWGGGVQALPKQRVRAVVEGRGSRRMRARGQRAASVQRDESTHRHGQTRGRGSRLCVRRRRTVAELLHLKAGHLDHPGSRGCQFSLCTRQPRPAAWRTNERR